MPKLTPYVSKAYVVPNDYFVSKSIWRKWSQQQRKLYNDVFGYAIDNQLIFSHPKGPVLHKDHWKTLAHNFAFTAADNLR